MIFQAVKTHSRIKNLPYGLGFIFRVGLIIKSFFKFGLGFIFELGLVFGETR